MAIVEKKVDINNSGAYKMPMVRKSDEEIEDSFMKEHQHEINKLVAGFKSQQTIDSERDKTPFEIFQSRYFHLQVCHPDHPLFSKYKEEFKKIKYDAEYSVWKEQYYKYYYQVYFEFLEYDF